MTQILARAKTQAEIILEQQFAALGSVSAERRAAFERFSQQGLPNKRVEAYHFTDLRQQITEALPLAQQTQELDHEGFITLVYGVCEPHAIPLPDGVSLEILSDPRPEGLPADSVIDLNLAFCGQEYLLEVAPGTHLEQAIAIDQLVDRKGSVNAAFARLRVKVGAGAKLILHESLAHSDQGRGRQGNLLTIFEIGAGAHVEHAAKIIWNGPQMLLTSVYARLETRATFHSFALNNGTANVRRQLFVDLEGEHADLQLDGLTQLAGDTQADTTLVVSHIAAHCASREQFRHIIADEGIGVFQGKIIVAPGAQKTDGKMMSRAILLDETAAMLSKPELEIFADDVVCGHGATVSTLDEDQLFYLRARGLPVHDAKALLLQAFADDLIDGLSNEAIREEMNAEARRWLDARGANNGI